jgi:hypothetical protein
MKECLLIALQNLEALFGHQSDELTRVRFSSPLPHIDKQQRHKERGKEREPWGKRWGEQRRSAG